MVISDPKLFREQISDLEGDYMMTITPISGKATSAQIYRFRKVIIPLFVNLSVEAGQPINEVEAEQVLINEVAGGADIENMKVKEMISLIEGSKAWLNQIFGTENKSIC